MTAQIHHFAAERGQSASEAYDRGRPEYSLDAVEHLLQELEVGEASTVVLVRLREAGLIERSAAGAQWQTTFCPACGRRMIN